MGQRNVTGLGRSGGQRHTNQPRLHGIKRIGFRVDCQKTLLTRRSDPLIEAFKGSDRFIIAMAHRNGAKCALKYRVIPAKAGSHGGIR